MLLSRKKKTFYDNLYTEMFLQLLHMVNHYVYDPGEAEDILQETFLEAYRHLDTLYEHENPQGWMFVTARNKVRKYWDASRKRMAAELLEDFQGNEYAKQGDPNEDVFMTLSEIELLLTPEEFELFYKRFVEERPYDEIAEKLGISAGACRVRASRIKKKLQAELGGEAMVLLFIIPRIILF